MNDQLIQITSIDIPLEGLDVSGHHAFGGMLGNCEMEVAAQALLRYSQENGAWVGVSRRQLTDENQGIPESTSTAPYLNTGLWLLEHYHWITRIVVNNLEYDLPTYDLAKRIIERQTGKEIVPDPNKELAAMMV